jgi:hypothetical protein
MMILRKLLHTVQVEPKLDVDNLVIANEMVQLLGAVAIILLPVRDAWNHASSSQIILLHEFILDIV